MNDCSKLIKLCGLKSTAQCAALNGVNKINITRAYNSNSERFKNYVITALKHQQTHDEIKLNLDLDKLNNKLNNLKAFQKNQIKKAKELLK